MSYTVVVDEQYHERQIENRLNVVMRHCKIGKVRSKSVPEWVWRDRPKPRPKRETFFRDPLPWVSSPILGLGHVTNA